MRNQPEQELPPVVVVRLSGTGGQGLVLMGHLLASAVALRDGLNVVMTKSYGPEARGGASRTDVIIGPGEINELAGTSVDILLSLSQAACDKYYPALVPHGLLIVDSTYVSVVPTNRAIEVPITETAIKTCNNRMCANVVALGFLCGFTNLASQAAVESAVGDGVKPAFRELNLKALACGYELAASVRQGIADQGRTQKIVPDYGHLREQPKAAARPRRVAKTAVKGTAPAAALV